MLFAERDRNPEQEAEAFINADAGFADIKAVLDGARHILVEQFSEDAKRMGQLREKRWQKARIISAVVDGKENEGTKYSDYFESSEGLDKLHSLRAEELF